MIQYADLLMDLADASFVLLAEELGQGRIIFADRRDLYSFPSSSFQSCEAGASASCSQAGAWEQEDFLYVSILLFK
jgi:hypothetical protein